MVHVGVDVWKKHLAGTSIIDCAVRDKDTIYICARPNVDPEAASMSWDTDHATHLCVIYLESTEDNNLRGWQYEGLDNPRLGVALNPLPCGVLISRNVPNEVVLMGKGVNPREVIDPNSLTIVMRVKTIFGDVYSVGGKREIYRRLAADTWQLLPGLPIGGDVFKVGFNDLDAFSECDMYAVGGRGDVWHFDGVNWLQKGFPSNVKLSTVTCGGDGNVYITGEGGSIWKGRDSTWEQIYEGSATILWNDALWFNDQLWLSSDYRLRIWDGNVLRPPIDSNGDEVLMSGHMDARDGLLAIADTDSVMTFDGKEWRVIVAPYE